MTAAEYWGAICAKCYHSITAFISLSLWCNATLQILLANKVTNYHSWNSCGFSVSKWAISTGRNDPALASLEKKKILQKIWINLIGVQIYYNGLDNRIMINSHLQPTSNKRFSQQTDDDDIEENDLEPSWTKGMKLNKGDDLEPRGWPWTKGMILNKGDGLEEDDLEPSWT